MAEKPDQKTGWAVGGAPTGFAKWFKNLPDEETAKIIGQSNKNSLDFSTLKTTLKKYFKSKNIRANVDAIDTFNDYNFVDQITMICPLANNEKQLLLETTSILKREKLLQTILDSYVSEEYISDISKH